MYCFPHKGSSTFYWREKPALQTINASHEVEKLTRQHWPLTSKGMCRCTARSSLSEIDVRDDSVFVSPPHQGIRTKTLTKWQRDVCVRYACEMSSSEHDRYKKWSTVLRAPVLQHNTQPTSLSLYPNHELRCSISILPLPW